MWAYEARRLFRDRLVGEKAMDQFDAILSSVLRSDWSVDIASLNQSGGAFYVTWGASHGMSPDPTLSCFGRPLGRLSAADLQEIVTKGITAYGENSVKLGHACS